MVGQVVQWVAFLLAAHLFRQTLLLSHLGRFLSSEVQIMTQQQVPLFSRTIKEVRTELTALSIQDHYLTHLTYLVEERNLNKLLSLQGYPHCRISIYTSKVIWSFSNFLIDFLKKVNSDYPYPPVTGRRGRSSHHNHSKSYMTKNIIESLPEMVVEEEKNEEEEVCEFKIYLLYYRLSTKGPHGSLSWWIIMSLVARETVIVLWMVWRKLSN